MNVAELLKRLAAQNPELAKALEPSNGCQGFVTYRGKKYVGNFNPVLTRDGKAYGILQMTDWGQKSPFSDRQIPIGEAQGGHIEFNPDEGVFQGIIDDKVPCSGDRAYTKYHGYEYEGVLRLRGDKTHIHFGCVEPADPGENWGYHDPSTTRGITVGYDEPIVWDEARGMYYAAADYD